MYSVTILTISWTRVTLDTCLAPCLRVPTRGGPSPCQQSAVRPGSYFLLAKYRQLRRCRVQPARCQCGQHGVITEQQQLLHLDAGDPAVHTDPR